jgi:hypothetical protein
MDELGQIEAGAYPVLGDARVRIVPEDPLATGDDSVGFRCFHQYPSVYYFNSASARAGQRECWPEIETRTSARLLLYADLTSVAKLAANRKMHFIGVPYPEMWDGLLADVVKEAIALLVGVTKLPAPPDRSVHQVPGQASLPAHEEPAALIEQETHIGAVRWLEEHVDLSQEAISDLLDVSRQTVINWLKGGAIRDENRQRLLAVRDILERVRRRHHHNSDSLKTWLDTPRGPDGTTPRQLLTAGEIGKARALSLSTAAPPPRLAPEWLRESPPDPWTLRQQRRRERVVRDEPTPDADAAPNTGGADHD